MASGPSTPLAPSASENLEELARKLRASDRAYPYSFVDPFPQEVQHECPICLEILRIYCCGSKFCPKCTKSLQPIKCPLCNAKEVQFFPEKQLERQINQRKVYCFLKKDGCDWTGELCKMNDHLDGLNDVAACRFFPVPCDNCSEYVRRGNMNVHKICCNSQLKCDFCECQVKTQNELKIHYKTCPASPYVCTNRQCNKAVKELYELNAHKRECPWSPLTCEYHHAGCCDTILRKDMESHLKENMQEHLDLVKAKLSRLEQEMQGMEQEMQGRGEVSFLVVSDLPEEALEEHRVKSRFGQFGSVESVEILDEYYGAAIVIFSNPNDYQKVIDESRRGNIRLCREKVQVNPVYSAEY